MKLRMLRRNCDHNALVVRFKDGPLRAAMDSLLEKQRQAPAGNLLVIVYHIGRYAADCVWTTCNLLDAAAG